LVHARATELEARYIEATGRPFDVYSAYLYDAANVLAKAIIETSSDNATIVTTALPRVCENTYGASSWLRLNKYGDRAPTPFDIWYFAPGTIKPADIHIAGIYNPDTSATIWNKRTTDYTIKGPLNP
jgi:ABC-type branched-subunit amino acid transport system substrate-binding protein